LYGYVGNDPINFIDLDGEHPVPAAAALLYRLYKFLKNLPKPKSKHPPKSPSKSNSKPPRKEDKSKQCEPSSTPDFEEPSEFSKDTESGFSNQDTNSNYWQNRELQRRKKGSDTQRGRGKSLY
jgi:hypothetical protein